MTDAFEEREKAFEAKFEHDMELAFKVNVRRNKLVGLWAAELMGLTGDEAQAYAREVIEAELAQASVRINDKIRQDLESRGVDLSEHRLEKKLEELREKAKDEIMRA